MESRQIGWCCMEVIGVTSGRPPSVHQPEGSTAVFVRDKDTRIRIALQGALADRLWRMLDDYLTDEGVSIGYISRRQYAHSQVSDRLESAPVPGVNHARLYACLNLLTALLPACQDVASEIRARSLSHDHLRSEGPAHTEMRLAREKVVRVQLRSAARLADLECCPTQASSAAEAPALRAYSPVAPSDRI